MGVAQRLRHPAGRKERADRDTTVYSATNHSWSAVNRSSSYWGAQGASTAIKGLTQQFYSHLIFGVLNGQI